MSPVTPTTVPTMEPSFMPHTTASLLKSPQQSELLDAIDTLRRENIDAEIDIPQIVVCGDQSSGKSSLLEAIAQVPFPAGDGTTTLFATEVILRHANKSKIRFTIDPLASRPDKQKESLRKFERSAETMSRAGFLDFHNEASKCLKDLDSNQALWYDKLRIEICGPDQPHLTLVDLPGLIRNPTGKQTINDRDAIVEMVKSYMANERAVIIAVVCATSDFQTQEIGNLVKESGKAISRTLGVITKPDGILGTDQAKRWIGLSQSQELPVRLGWHVVKNLHHEAVDRSPQNRDAVEEKFFASGVWSTLPSDDCGIQNLRQKLRQNLLACIIRDLPKLLVDLNRKLTASKHVLNQLGPARESDGDHREYLIDIATKLRALTVTALEGTYENPEGVAFFDRIELKRLRDTITSISDKYALQMRTSGVQYRVLEKRELKQRLQRLGGSPFPVLDPCFFSPYTSTDNVQDTNSPHLIGVEQYCHALAAMMQKTRGKDLPGMLTRGTIQAIFRQQSVKWEQITRKHIHECQGFAISFMSLAVSHLTDRHVAQKLMQQYINPAFDKRFIKLEKKLMKLLWPFQHCHPITDNPAFTEALRYDHSGSMDSGSENDLEDGYHDSGSDDGCEDSSSRSADIGFRWAMYARKHRFSSSDTAAAKALDQAEAYYDIALNNFIDNVATLAIEHCLLHGLPDLVSSKYIGRLSSEDLRALGAEPHQAREDRAKAKTQSQVLEKVIRTLLLYVNQYSANQPTHPTIPLELARETTIPAARERDASAHENPTSMPAAVLSGNPGGPTLSTAHRLAKESKISEARKRDAPALQNPTSMPAAVSNGNSGGPTLSAAPNSSPSFAKQQAFAGGSKSVFGNPATWSAHEQTPAQNPFLFSMRNTHN